MFNMFTQRARNILALAREEATRMSHDYIGTEHILLGIIREGEGIASLVLQRLSIDLESVRTDVENRSKAGAGNNLILGDIPFNPGAKNAIERAMEESRQLGHSYIGTEHLLLGIIAEGEGVAAQVLANLGVKYDDVLNQILDFLGGASSDAGETKPKSTTPTLDDFGRDLTKMASENLLDPVIGRRMEIERVIQILSRRTKNNPVLIGEPGVGKTAIVEGLAHAIISGDVPEIIAHKRLITLDMSSVVAGTKYRGQFEERLKGIISEIQKSTDVILFIDELHTIIGAGGADGAIDASNMLKPALARGELQCIGATTLDEYRKHIEKDGALERRFQMIIVEPPSVDQTIKILAGLRDKYEAHHKVKITDDAIYAASHLSEKYVMDRFLPDKAIDLIDEASSMARTKSSTKPLDISDLKSLLEETTQEKETAIKMQDFEKAATMRDKERDVKTRIEDAKRLWRESRNKECPVIGVEEICLVISRWTNIPVTRLKVSEKNRYLEMEAALHATIVGQDDAVNTLGNAIRRSMARLKDPKRPVGSFLFLGPTGVGKSALAKALAAFLFGSESALITVDMSEYTEKHSLSRLIGSPPGYVGYDEGGQLTEKVRRKPYAVILFDEIEKAHPDLYNILLQIMEDGHLTDGLGHKVDFRNAVIIMTSNLGARDIEKSSKLGFVTKSDEDNHELIKERVGEEIKRTFRPEFINRIDEILIFQQLTRKELAEIVGLMLKDLLSRLAEQGITLDVSEAMTEFLVNQSYEPSFGARPLRRTIQKYIENPLAEAILASQFNDDDHLEAEVTEERIIFKRKEKIEQS